jgi:hypothetical protein
MIKYLSRFVIDKLVTITGTGKARRLIHKIQSTRLQGKKIKMART